MSTDTIAAIATAMSPSGIGIVRISGENALIVADKIFVSKNKRKKISEMESHTIHYGFIKDEGEIIDEVILLIMKAPNSYTREDTIEIDCHGGISVIKRVLETVIKNGARPAQPGEFTKRAFLNGRIDLTQAEAVIDVINAKNDFALKSSQSQLRGSVYKKVSSIRDELLYEIAFIESALDDPEHVSLEGYPEKLCKIVQKNKDEIDRLLENSEKGRILKDGIQTVIIGKPNAGKSTLLNALLDEDRAIVTEIAGTTRDALTEQINIGNIILNVTDTAGIRETEDIVEKIGVEKSLEYIQKADLIIYVADSSTDIDENDKNIIDLIKDKNAIILLNKSDLESKTDRKAIKEKLDKPVLSVSAKEKEGIEEFEKLIEEMFNAGDIDYNDEIYVTGLRQKTALADASASLGMVMNGISLSMPEDFLTIDLMAAYEKLSEIIGESVDEDVINEIFSKFCVGK